MKVSIDILCKYFSFLVYHQNVQHLNETFDTLIDTDSFETLSDSFSFVDRQTDKSKDQAMRFFQKHVLYRETE